MSFFSAGDVASSTWHAPLQNIHCEFYGDGITSIDTTEGILLGRPYGGLAVLWQKSLNRFVKVMKLEDETRLMGFDINFGTILYHIMNVYIPFDCNDNMNDSIYYLNTIDTVCKKTILFITWLLEILILTCWGHLCSGECCANFVMKNVTL